MARRFRDPAIGGRDRGRPHDDEPGRSPGPARRFNSAIARRSATEDVVVNRVAYATLCIIAGASKLAVKTLLAGARGGERLRAEAAAKVLATLKGGEALLVEALSDAEEEVGAQVLAEVINPLSSKLSKKDVAALLKAGAAQLGKAFAVARRQLEPVRNADPHAWADALRDKAKALAKKDEARSDAIVQLLMRSSMATADDRYGYAVQALSRSPMDPHPQARRRDPAVGELEKLLENGFPLVKRLEKDKAVSDEGRLYLGFHFVEAMQPEAKGFGAALLEQVAGKGKGKRAKAAKNKRKWRRV